MNEKQKIINFNSWISTMDDRISDWLETLSKNDFLVFDFSVNSLDEMEKYLIEKYELKDLNNSNNKIEIDACMSYVLEVFRKNWTKSEFTIELKDEKNILFNRPAIRVIPAKGMDFSPYQILPSIINLKKVGRYRKIYDSKL